MRVLSVWMRSSNELANHSVLAIVTYLQYVSLAVDLPDEGMWDSVARVFHMWRSQKL